MSLTNDMNLFLIRHSIAENPSTLKSDSLRELTADGKSLVIKMVNFYKLIAPNIDLILTSPFLRAIQTAGLISSFYENKINIIKENNLAAGCNTGTLIEILNIYDYENIAIIGHQPDLSNHISNFTSSANVNLVFRPASIAKIRFEYKIGFNKGVLEYLISSGIVY